MGLEDYARHLSTIERRGLVRDAKGHRGKAIREHLLNGGAWNLGFCAIFRDPGRADEGVVAFYYDEWNAYVSGLRGNSTDDAARHECPPGITGT